MKSPCLNCHNADGDKNADECRKCGLRHDYVNGLDVDVFKVAVPKTVINEEECMSKRGQCENCSRENMTLPARGLCGMCNTAFLKATETAKARGCSIAEAQAEALCEAREKVEGGIIPIDGRQRKGKIAGPGKANKPENKKKLAKPGVDSWACPKDPSDPMNTKPLPLVSVILSFTDSERDQKLLAGITKMADQNRRTIDMECMCVLEAYCANEKALKDRLLYGFKSAKEVEEVLTPGM